MKAGYKVYDVSPIPPEFAVTLTHKNNQRTTQRRRYDLQGTVGLGWTIKNVILNQSDGESYALFSHYGCCHLGHCGFLLE